MAHTLPNPNLNFVPLDVLTAEELNQIVANINELASLFPLKGDNIADGAIDTSQLVNGAVTSAKIGSNAVTTAKIQNGAVTLAKLASDARSPLKLLANYTRTSQLSADSYQYVEIDPSGYNHLIINISGQTAAYAGDSWIDMRAFEDNSTTPIKWNWNRVKTAGNAVVGESGSQSTFLIALTATGYTAFQMRVEVCNYTSGSWPLFLTQGATPSMSVYGAAQRYNSTAMPTRFGIAAGPAIQAGLNIQVWGSA